MSVSLDGAAAPAGVDQRASSFDLAQRGPSRGVPTLSLWDKPRAASSDFEKFKDKNSQSLAAATKNLRPNEADTFEKLIFVSSREEKAFPEISKKAASTAGAITASPSDLEMVSLLREGRDIVKGYVASWK
jgi:hypothetical protein